jgi:hypothetical protein
VLYPGRQYYVAPEHLRPAAGFENWTPSADDIRALREGQKLAKREKLPNRTTRQTVCPKKVALSKTPDPNTGQPEQEHFDRLAAPIPV